MCHIKPFNSDKIAFLILLGKICAKMSNFKIGALYFSSVIVSTIFLDIPIIDYLFEMISKIEPLSN